MIQAFTQAFTKASDENQNLEREGINSSLDPSFDFSNLFSQI